MIRNLDLTALRSFVTVAETGGVTRAAHQLHLTQSAVSMQIKRLEEMLQQPLLDRAGRGVQLTAHGEQLLGYGRRILAINDEVISRMMNDAFEGELRLGVPTDIVYPHIPRVLRPAAAGAVLGTAALWVPDILGIGAETLRFATIAGAIPPPELALILVAKLLATAMCLGFGFSGGVFSPALLIGALFGALCGNAVALVTDGVQATMVVYAVAGMVAVTAPVIGAPMATLLIVFELTGSYTLTTAALASVALANLTGARVFGRSLFDVQLRRRGLDLSAGRSRALLQGERIAPLVQPAPVTLAPDLPIAAAIDTLGRRGRAEGYLVDADGGYRGTVTLAALEARRGQGSAPVLDAAEAERPVVAADSSLWVAVDQARTLTGEALPVVERGGRRLVGVLPEVALSRAHVETLDAVRREEHGGG